jgi:hypothetical protein
MRFVFLLLVLITTTPVWGQQNGLGTTKVEKIKIFLDCDDCDFVFFRNNLQFVDFVRDARLSDVHVMVVEQRTAGRGTEYRLNFIGQNQFEDINFQLKTVSSANETDVMVWDRLMKKLKTGLMPFITESNAYNNVEISYIASVVDSLSIITTDPWNFWVFRMQVGADIDMEERQGEFAFESAFDADRITEKFKFRSEISYEINVENFEDDDKTITSRREEAEVETEFVFSLNPRWSVGLFTEAYMSTFLNYDFAHEFSGAVEYNIFPWDVSDKKIFTLAYHLNSNYFQYNEKTIFGKTREWVPSQSVRLQLVLRQPWGEISNTIQGSNFFHDFSKNRISIDTDFSVQVARGLFIYTNIYFNIINDQIYLPAGNASLEEILLRQRQLATGYSFWGRAGIRYTFGSFYNNIVNQRL